MLKAMIIDDEKNACENLSQLLNDYKNELEIVAVSTSSVRGLETLRELKPDLLFLDVDMPGMNGIELFEKISDMRCNVIFTTAHNEYAIKAIHMSALDYLLKPIDPEQLAAAIQKAKKKKEASIRFQQYKIFTDRMNRRFSDNSNIALPTMDGLEFINIRDIVRCEADGNYTKVFLSGKNSLLITRSIKEFELLLSDFDFVRVHNSHLINAHRISKYFKGDGGYVTMSDGSSVDVSRSRKEQFLSRLKKL